VLLCVIWDHGALHHHLREVAPYAALGYVVTAASFGFQQIMSSGLPAIAPAAADEYLSVFLRYWDVHRVPLDLFSLNVVLVWLGLCFSLIGIRFFKRDLPGGSLFLMRSLVASAVLGLGLSLLQQLPLQLPTALTILMPSRILNFNVLAYLPVLLGLLWRYRSRISAQLNLLLLIVIFALSPLPTIFGIVILLVSGLAFVASAAFSRSRPPTLLSVSSSHPSSLRLHSPLPSVGDFAGQALIPHPSSFITFTVSRTTHHAVHNTLYLSTLLALAIILVLTGVRSYAVWSSRQDLFRDYTNDPLFTEISRGQGLLLTGTGSSMHLFQLYTRRPVLLDVEALDMLPYALEGGPQFERILREVYGIEFDNPPQEARHRGVLPVEPIRTIWQQRTPEQWAAIAAGFGVSDIVTSADWELQLPEVARNDRFILYRIP
jgi:hypothetical protein